MSTPRDPNEPTKPNPTASGPAASGPPPAGPPPGGVPAGAAAGEPIGDPAGEPSPEERQDRRVAIAIVAGLVVVALALLAWWLLAGDDDEDTTTTTTSSSTTELTTTTTSTTTTSTPEDTAPPTTFDTTLDDEELATVIWPDQDTSRRFSDPEPAVFSFATDWLGFVEPIVGEFRAGDSRSGEVELRATEDGPVTTVLVRQMGDDSWWIIGAQARDIVVDQPEPGATVQSPIPLAGESLAFEALVNVEVRRDGSAEAIGEGSVMGGATGELEPFSGEVAYDAGDAQWGAVLFSTTSPRDGNITQATVVRVRFG